MVTFLAPAPLPLLTAIGTHTTVPDQITLSCMEPLLVAPTCGARFMTEEATTSSLKLQLITMQVFRAPLQVGVMMFYNESVPRLLEITHFIHFIFAGLKHYVIQNRTRTSG